MKKTKIQKVEHKIEVLNKFYNDKLLKYKKQIYLLKAEQEFCKMRENGKI